jgi:hypothetical protein
VLPDDRDLPVPDFLSGVDDDTLSRGEAIA